MNPQLLKLLEMLKNDEYVKSTDFVDAFVVLADVVDTLKEKYTNMHSEAVDELADAVRTLRENFEKTMNDKVNPLVSTKDFLAYQQEMKDKLADIGDSINTIELTPGDKGDDAEITEELKEEIVESALALFKKQNPIPTPEEWIKMINALPTDKDEFKIDIKHIKGMMPQMFVPQPMPSGGFGTPIETVIKAGANVTVTKDASGAWVIASTGGGGGGGTWGSITGTLSAQTDLQSALDAKISSIADPNADRLFGWDDTDGAYKFITIGTNLSYDHATHTLSSSGSGGTPTVITVANEATDATCFVAFFTAATGDLGPKTNAGLTFNSATGMFTATGLTGPLTGNASTATALQNARTIGGVSFDGTANITVATATGGFTVSGGNLALGTNSITMTGSIGITGARVTKGWFTDLEVTNAIVGSITGNAGTASAVAVGGITGLGTGVATALAVNVGTAGAFVVNGGALGTPSSGTVTNLTGTASININGTVGATTPTTGAFTTATANSFIPNLSTIPSNGMYLPAANTLGWAINSAAELQLTGTALSPAADGGSSLGTTALGWQNLFGNTGFVLNVENGDWVATHTAGILTVGTGDLRVTTAGTNSASAVTVGGTQTLTAKTLTTPVINGTITGTGQATAATASTIAMRDSSGNLSAVNALEGYTTTATAAGTTTLTVASNNMQYFTGATTQTVVMPVTSTLVLGQSWWIVNLSSGAVTVNSSGANAIVIVAAGCSAEITCVLTSGTSAASWNAMYIADIVTSGKKFSVSNTLTLAGTDGTTMTFPSTSATIARTDAANTFTGVQTMTSPALTTPAITGLATGSGVASAATASTLASRDSNANLSANNWLGGYTTTATAAGTTTLTVASTYQQFFTGSTTQTVVLPVTSTLTLGHQFIITNNSSGIVTIQSSGANTVLALAASSTAIVTCILTSGTSAASWSVSSAPNTPAAAGGGGEWTYVSKVSFANASGTQTFSSLASHDFYKIVFNVGNTTSNALTFVFTINNITAANTYSYFNITNTTINQINTGTSYPIARNSSEQATLVGEIVIQGKHNNGTKAIIPSVGAGNIVSDEVAVFYGQMSGNSADVSSIEINSANAVTGQIELWYKDNK